MPVMGANARLWKQGAPSDYLLLDFELPAPGAPYLLTIAFPCLLIASHPIELFVYGCVFSVPVSRQFGNCTHSCCMVRWCLVTRPIQTHFPVPVSPYIPS